MPQKSNERDQRTTSPVPQDHDDELETAEDEEDFEEDEEFDDEAVVEEDEDLDE
jgi:hypothetical protein